MKNIIIMLLTGFMVFPVFSSINDMVFLVSSKGPDTYQDMSPILDNEKYAIVWTANNKEFEGFNSDGSLIGTNSTWIAAVPARNGRLPKILLQINESIYNPNGTYSLHLLDTRVKNSRTGKRELIETETGVTNICSYSTLASGFKAVKFDRMTGVPSGIYVAANGYVDPIVENPIDDGPIVPALYNPNLKYANDGVTLGTYTNEVTVISENYVEITNTITKTMWHDEIRYNDVTNYFAVTNFVVITNVVDVTNTIVKTIYETKYEVKIVEKPVYTYLTITNRYDDVFGDVKESIPTAISKKKSSYTSLVIDSDIEVGTATIQLNKPNAYCLTRVVFKMKIGKKTISDILYGIIDDDGCLFAYGKDKNDRLIFNGKNLEGTIEYKGTVYEIDGMFNK